MRIKGAIHIHSTLSNDGELSMPELAQLYSSHGFKFLGISEHAEHMNEQKLADLLCLCRENSRPDLLLIPGLESVCDGDYHIVGFGAPELIPESQREPVSVCHRIRAQGGLPILAHPKRYGWKAPVEILRAAHAVEIWNITYDGKLLPSQEAPAAWAEFQSSTPGLLAIAGHDLHGRQGFYDVGIVMDVPELSRESIFARIQSGEYSMQSTFFLGTSHTPFSPGAMAWLQLLRWPLDRVQWMRRRMRWAT